MKVLSFIGALIYSFLMYYLIWLFFYWITPYLMFISWGLFIVYLIFAGGFLSMLVASISALISTPLVVLCRKNGYIKYAPIIWGVLFGYSSLKLPWTFNMDYSVLQWIIATSLTIIILITFISLLTIPFKKFED